MHGSGEAACPSTAVSSCLYIQCCKIVFELRCDNLLLNEYMMLYYDNDGDDDND